MKIGTEKDDRDILLLAIGRLGHQDLGRFVLITETEKKDHFGVVFSDEIEDAMDLLSKSVDNIEKAIDFRRDNPEGEDALS